MTTPDPFVPTSEILKTELLILTNINREDYNNITTHQTAVVMLDCMRYVFTESMRLPVLPDIKHKFNICIVNIEMYTPMSFDKIMTLLNNLCFCWREFIKHQKSNYKTIKYIIDNWNNNLTEFLNILNPESSLNYLMYIYLENETSNPCLFKKDIGVIYIKKEYMDMIDRTTQIINSIGLKFEYETKLQFGKLIIDEINKIIDLKQLVINSPEKMNIIKNDNFYSWVKLMFSFANWSISEYIFGLLFELPQQICSFLSITNGQSLYVYSNTLEIIKLFFGGFLPLDAEFNSPSSFIGNLLNFPTKEKILKYELFYKYAQAMNNKIIQLIKISKYSGLCVIKCCHCKIKGVTEKFIFSTIEISCSACGKSFIN